jgi:repressor LexA
MLTKRQSELLGYVYGYQRERGYAPTIREMATALELKSPGSVVRMLDRLQQLGFIRRERGRERALEVLKVPGAIRRETEARGAA